MKWQALALVLLLATAAVLPTSWAEEAEVDDDEDFDEERAQLLVRRVVADERPLEGRQTTVTISLYNAGNAPATGVKVTDAPWPADAFAVEGDLTASFDSIPAGASVQLSYKVTSKEAGFHTHPPTVVTYTPGEEEEAQSATGAPLPFQTFTIVESALAQALELGSKLTAGNLNTASDWKRFGIMAAAVATAALAYRSWGSVSESNRSRKRAKALAELAELEKDK